MGHSGVKPEQGVVDSGTESARKWGTGTAEL